MKKTFTTLDVLNIIAFNNKLTEEKNNAIFFIFRSVIPQMHRKQ